MLISLILMFNSPKPDFIFDANNHAIGIKNKDGNLEIYADKISKFNRQYWANWFGQKDANVLPLTDHVFRVSNNKTISLNYKNNECTEADVQINISNNCMSGELIITQDLLKLAGGIIIIFCNPNKCSVKYDDNSRFR